MTGAKKKGKEVNDSSGCGLKAIFSPLMYWERRFHVFRSLYTDCVLTK